VKRSLLLAILVLGLCCLIRRLPPAQKRTTPTAAPRQAAAAPARTVPLAEAVPFVNKTLSNGLGNCRA